MGRARWPGLLLLGPRGRQFCFSATRVDVFELQVSAMNMHAEPPPAGKRVVWSGGLPVTADVLNAVAAAITTDWHARGHTAITEVEAYDALADTTGSATYWQPPDDDDLVAAAPVVVRALEPVAATVAGSSAVDWWDRPVSLPDQHFVSWIHTPHGRRAAPPLLTGTAERLRQWRKFMKGPRTSVWWSYPDVVSTSAAHGALPATQLELVEDSLGSTRARVARLEPAPGCRVLELVTPQDWIDLVDAHPLDVTHSRDDSWPQSTGGRGPWFLPDWFSVSHEYDAVHLTVLAYLSTAGRALPCSGGTTVLAGWEPDVTYWLTDTLSQVEPPATWTITEAVDEPTSHWTRV